MLNIFKLFPFMRDMNEANNIDIFLYQIKLVNDLVNEQTFLKEENLEGNSFLCFLILG